MKRILFSRRERVNIEAACVCVWVCVRVDVDEEDGGGGGDGGRQWRTIKTSETVASREHAKSFVLHTKEIKRKTTTKGKTQTNKRCRTANEQDENTQKKKNWNKMHGRDTTNEMRTELKGRNAEFHSEEFKN